MVYEQQGQDGLLTIEDLTVDYQLADGRTLRAVSDANFKLNSGEILGIVGESGSGKSTIGRVIAGFIPAASGTLIFGAEKTTNWDKAPKNGRANVQMIFQNSTTALDPRMRVSASIGEALAGGGRIRRQHEKEALAYMEKVGLDIHFANRRPGDLSGGQRQRVAIARALAMKPEVLVCDESVAALDVSARAKILNLLSRLRRDLGISIIFISHDLAVVSHLADRVVVMQNGKVVESGPTMSVVRTPEHSYTRTLLAAVPRLEWTSLESS